MTPTKRLTALKDLPPWEWPKDADQLILAVLADKEAKAAARLLAAELAGDFTVINEALVGELLGLVEQADAEEELRCQAALSFGPVLEHGDIEGFDDPDELDELPIAEATFHKVQASLQRVFQDASAPEELRRSALEASVRAPQDWHAEEIRAAYGSGAPSWKLTAVFAMRWVPGFKREVLEALGSDDPQVRYQAVHAAGNWELDEAWPQVAQIVSRGADKPLLLAAIEAVASIRPQAAEELLGERLDDEDEEIAEAAAEALAMAEVWEELEGDDEEELAGQDED